MIRLLLVSALLSGHVAHAQTSASVKAGLFDFHLSDRNFADGRAAAYAMTSVRVNGVVLDLPVGPLGNWGGYVDAGSSVEGPARTTWYTDSSRTELSAEMDVVDFGSAGSASTVQYGIWLAPYSRLDITIPVWLEWNVDLTSQVWMGFYTSASLDGGASVVKENSSVARFDGGRDFAGEKYRLVKISFETFAEQAYGQIRFDGSAEVHYNSLVPEPNAVGLMLMGLFGVAVATRRNAACDSRPFSQASSKSLS